MNTNIYEVCIHNSCTYLCMIAKMVVNFRSLVNKIIQKVTIPPTHTHKKKREKKERKKSEKRREKDEKKKQ